MKGTTLNFPSFGATFSYTFRWFPFRICPQSFSGLLTILRALSWRRFARTCAFLHGSRVRRPRRSLILSRCLRRPRPRTWSRAWSCVTCDHLPHLLPLLYVSFYCSFCPSCVSSVFCWIFLPWRRLLRWDFSWTLMRSAVRRAPCLSCRFHLTSFMWYFDLNIIRVKYIIFRVI